MTTEPTPPPAFRFTPRRALLLIILTAVICTGVLLANHFSPRLRNATGDPAAPRPERH
ncbi:MAG TPA: hypothetical protein VHM90_21405 [Phycisphaerae bacterium]|nr:hypothetical protein [Phycisphaerae bacterium]